ncbi:MAG: hypothetical protein JWO26_2948 [Rhodospirillales bacterium]|nr:hypothetical protein [Rhodospirillales bacterium]
MGRRGPGGRRTAAGWVARASSCASRRCISLIWRRSSATVAASLPCARAGAAISMWLRGRPQGRRRKYAALSWRCPHRHFFRAVASTAPAAASAGTARDISANRSGSTMGQSGRAAQWKRGSPAGTAERPGPPAAASFYCFVGDLRAMICIPSVPIPIRSGSHEAHWALDL